MTPAALILSKSAQTSSIEVHLVGSTPGLGGGLLVVEEHAVEVHGDRRLHDFAVDRDVLLHRVGEIGCRADLGEDFVKRRTEIHALEVAVDARARLQEDIRRRAARNHVEDVHVGAGIVLDDREVGPFDARLRGVFLKDLDRRGLGRRGPVVVDLELDVLGEAGATAAAASIAPAMPRISFRASLPPWLSLFVQPFTAGVPSRRRRRSPCRGGEAPTRTELRR